MHDTLRTIRPIALHFCLGVALCVFGSAASADAPSMRQKQMGAALKQKREREAQFQADMSRPMGTYEGLVGGPARRPPTTFRIDPRALVPPPTPSQAPLVASPSAERGSDGRPALRVSAWLLWDDPVVERSMRRCLLDGVPRVANRPVHFVPPGEPADLHLSQNTITSVLPNGMRNGYDASFSAQILGSKVGPQSGIAAGSGTEGLRLICEHTLGAVRTRLSQAGAGTHVAAPPGDAPRVAANVYSRDPQERDRLLRCVISRTENVFDQAMGVPVRWVEHYQEAEIHVDVYNEVSTAGGGAVVVGRVGQVLVDLPGSALPPRNDLYSGPGGPASLDALCEHAAKSIATRTADEIDAQQAAAPPAPRQPAPVAAAPPQGPGFVGEWRADPNAVADAVHEGLLASMQEGAQIDMAGAERMIDRIRNESSFVLMLGGDTTFRFQTTTPLASGTNRRTGVGTWRLDGGRVVLDYAASDDDDPPRVFEWNGTSLIEPSSPGRPLAYHRVTKP